MFARCQRFLANFSLSSVPRTDLRYCCESLGAAWRGKAPAARSECMSPGFEIHRIGEVMSRIMIEQWRKVLEGTRRV